MSLGISTRVKYPKKHDLAKSHSQSQILANKLRQDGIMSTVEHVMQAVDHMAAVLGSPTIDPTMSYKDSIINLCQHLKVYGAYLDILYQDQLNRAFVVFRNSSQDDLRLDYLSRLHLLELIELRAKDWKGTDLMNQYYRKKVEASESVGSMSDSMISMSLSSPTAPPMLSPGEIIKPSGKFKQPTRIPGKNYCKDEVVIRNADSGKVMGIKGRRVHMIEELSETIISFQRVAPGAKERLVQITGANEESINHAKQLIEDTIKRNASPVREHGIGVGAPLTGSSSSINSSASDESGLPQRTQGRSLLHSYSTGDATIGEYKYTVVTGGHTIKITGDNLDLVRTSKLVLDEYFSGEPIQDIGQFYSFDSLPQPILTNDLPPMPLQTLETDESESVENGQSEDSATYVPLRRPRLPVEDFLKGKIPVEPVEMVNGRFQYTIEYLARLALSPMCLIPPNDWDRINTEYPSLVRKVVEFFDAKQYLSNRSGEKMTSVLSADEIDNSEV